MVDGLDLLHVRAGFYSAGSEVAGVAYGICHGQSQAGSRLYGSKRWQGAVRRQLRGQAVEVGRGVAIYFGSRRVELAILDAESAVGQVASGIICDDTAITFTDNCNRCVAPNKVPGYEAETVGLAHEISGYFESKELYRHLRVRPPQTVYLVGVPGAGKTTVLQGALERLPYPVIHGNLSELVTNASGSEIADEYVAMALGELIDRSRASAPSVLVLGNIDILADTELADDITDLPSHFVRFTEQVPEGVMLILESSVADAELPASIRRCPALQHRLSISLPRLWQRKEIVTRVISRLCIADSLAAPGMDALVEQVANATAGYVARDIAALCRQAFLKQLRDTARSPVNDADALVQSLQQLSIGDRGSLPVPEWRYFAESLQIVRPSQQLEFEGARPSKRWTDIGGYEEIKQKLQRFVQLATSETPSRLGIKPPSGILLYGPSGCGKTAMAQAMIGESKCNVINIRGSELFSKYLGETEARLRRLFEAARAAAPCIVFMDEVDSIAAKREWAAVESGGPALRVLSTLLNEMDGVHETHGVVVIGCTNQLDKIDDAIARPGRFDQLVEIPLPTASNRLGILQTLAQKSPLAADVCIQLLSEMTAGFSGAGLEVLVREAGVSALRANRDAGAIQMCNFEHALAKVCERAH
ncbi:hypothetical protein LPJ63_003305 [Coemansia sp. RSA 2711]|nr:hypothetical protein LPJ63_003305 [Coemansia sp. RSA 2711]